MNKALKKALIFYSSKYKKLFSEGDKELDFLATIKNNQ